MLFTTIPAKPKKNKSWLSGLNCCQKILCLFFWNLHVHESGPTEKNGCEFASVCYGNKAKFYFVALFEFGSTLLCHSCSWDWQFGFVLKSFCVSQKIVVFKNKCFWKQGRKKKFFLRNKMFVLYLKISSTPVEKKSLQSYYFLKKTKALHKNSQLRKAFV